MNIVVLNKPQNNVTKIFFFWKMKKEGMYKKNSEYYYIHKRHPIALPYLWSLQPKHALLTLQDVNAWARLQVTQLDFGVFGTHCQHTE